MSNELNACGVRAHREKENSFKIEVDPKAIAHAEAIGLAPRPKETISEIGSHGEFVRQANSFITPFGDKEGEFKAEANRFAIYWGHGCHWSNRPVIVRDILGLEDVIADVAVQGGSIYGHGFTNQKDQKDPLTGVYFLSEFYKNAKPDYKGRATTPTLVDIIDKKAVNNDYHRLSNYIEVQFRKFQKNDIDLYPVKYRNIIDEFNDWLFPTINNGHYRMAFCQSPEAYDESYEDFFTNLEKIEKRLENNRFLFGDYITDSDVRLYVTLVRWETGYYHNVGPIHQRIKDYKNIWGYVTDLFSLPQFKKYTFFEFGNRGGNDLFKGYAERIDSKRDFNKFWASDGKRKELSLDPENVFKKHPVGETVEDYQTEISYSHWNDESWESRNPFNRTISVDPSINPIESKLRD